MDTSGSGIVNAVLYATMLALSIRIGLRLPARSTNAGGHRWVAAMMLLSLVAVPSLAQLAFPGLYVALHRDPDLIMHHGQWWRAVTSIVVQDGGLSGTIFNLASLAVVVVLAERVWGALPTLAIFGISALTLNVLAVAEGAAGAGNSGATFSLAMSMAGLAWMSRADAVTRLVALAATAIGVVLVLLGDGHGVAILFGALTGLLAATLVPLPHADEPVRENR